MKRSFSLLTLGLLLNATSAFSKTESTSVLIEKLPSVTQTLPTRLPPFVEVESRKAKMLVLKNSIKEKKSEILSLRAEIDHKGPMKPAPFLKTAEKSDDPWKNMAFINAQISDLKSRFFNKKLQAFDFKVQMFHQGKMSMASYVELLTQMKDKSLGPKTINPQINFFKKIHAMESKIDFQAVEKERAQVVRRLIYRLDSRSQQELRKMILAYRLGDVSHKEFYSYLQSACLKTGIKFNSYSSLSAYHQCVYLSDQLEQTKFFTELKKLEDQRYAGLIVRPAERSIKKHSTSMAAIASLVDLSMASEDWASAKNSPL